MLELAWLENCTFILHILSSELGNTQSPTHQALVGEFLIVQSPCSQV